ncbi:hypothetical protein HNQ08_002932 [Deinococcus humi]|uniref:Uncharacterized protein n=1 Tax=Deinococcus humi TaxID=662880 RepID=A0A7W8NFK7_9DEIO|nr:hypothetical protein [Deinococcus humi]
MARKVKTTLILNCYQKIDGYFVVRYFESCTQRKFLRLPPRNTVQDITVSEARLPDFDFHLLEV